MSNIEIQNQRKAQKNIYKKHQEYQQTRVIKKSIFFLLY
jgi:hypothetical protein